MPVSTDHLYGRHRTNLVFAVSAAILALSTIWLIKVDHERPWKEYQSGYMDSQAVLAELQYLVTQQESFQDQLTQARTLFEEQRKTIDRAQNLEYDRLLTLLEEKKAEQYNINLLFKQKDAHITVSRSELEQATAVEGAESAPARLIAAKLQEDEASLAETRLSNEQVDDAIRELNRARKNEEAGFTDARRALDELQKKVDEARDQRDRYSSVLAKAIFNAPLGDFVAPKGTPGRFEVKQVVAMGVKTKLNFLEGYAVDRCTTCHVVIDNENYSQRNLAAQFELAIPALNEALVLSDRSSSAPSIVMPEPPEIYGMNPEDLRGRVAEYWDRLSREDREAYFAQLQAGVNAYLDFEGLPTIDLEQPLQAHPDLDLFLSTDSPHPINKMGCTVCHEGNGSETDFVFAAHTPKSHHEKEEWTEKYYDRNLGVPTMTWSTLEHFWDFPMIPPQYSEASCAKCHDALDDIAQFQGRDYGEKIRTGKKLYGQLGCINCHRVENIEGLRQVGTDLRHVNSKLSAGFMNNWIFSPRDFRPATWMPHFFMQENSGPGSENAWDPDPELRTRTEVQAMTHYLQTVSEPWTAEVAPAGLSGNAAAGQQLFAEVGCLACHGNIAEYGESWIVNDLLEGQLTEDPDADEDEALELAEAQFAAMDLNAQVKYAVRHFSEERRKETEERAAREELLALSDRRDPDPRMLYVPPAYTRVAPDLSGVGSKVSNDWLYSWLREPRHYSSYTKMPRLRLTEQESVDLAAYLMTLKHDTFETAPFEVSEATVASLDRSMEDFLSGQNSAATVEKYKADADGLLTRTLVATLSKHAERAVQDARAQHYEQTLASMDLTEKKMLFVGHKTITHYGCYACHDISGFEAAPRPGTELTDWGEKSIHQLDFAFFGGAYHHTLAETDEFKELYPRDRTNLIEWSHSGNVEIDSVHTHSSFATLKLLNPRLWDRRKVKGPYAKLKMPNFYLAEDEVDALVTYLLSRRPARVADALKIQYDRELSGPIAEGRNLVRDLNCIGCHRIEDNVATLHQFISAAPEDDEDDWDDEEDEGDGEEEDDTGGALAHLGEGYGGEFDVPNGPPWLRGQGAKVQPEWFHSFLLNVETLRPWLKVRMPSFNLTGEQASILVDYFAALSKNEANDLNDELKQIHKYVAKSSDPESARNDWYRTGATASLAGLFRDYSVENELLKPFKFDFRKKDEAAIDEVYRDVLGNAEFFAHLYDIQYPFEYNDFTHMDAERFALGGRMFDELGCLACHVLGDPEVPGSNPAPSAPNLALAHKRIRYEWFRQWMREPLKIQPDTDMPQLFPGGRSYYATESDALRVPFEQAYSSDGGEQIRLLIDYIWQAGMTNQTAVDKSRLPGAEAADVPPPAAVELQPAAQVMPKPKFRRISGAIIDQATVGPRAGRIVKVSADAGTISGRVIWTGGELPNVHLPVAPDFRPTCCPNQATKPLDRIRVDGRTGGVRECVVYLAGAVEMPPFPASKQPVEIAIRDCQFDRRVTLVPRGGRVRFINGDDLAHNIRGRAGKILLWSKNLSKRGSTADLEVDKLGIIQTRSGSGLDWMDNYIWVVDHAGYALTDEEGRFTLRDIGPGEYTLHVWHPGIHTTTAGSGAGDGGPTGPAVNFASPIVIGGEISVLGAHETRVIVELQ